MDSRELSKFLLERELMAAHLNLSANEIAGCLVRSFSYDYLEKIFEQAKKQEEVPF